MSNTDLTLLLLLEHGWKCREGGLTHDHFGESGTRAVKMDNHACRLMEGRLESMREDLIGDAHNIYLRRIVLSPTQFARMGTVDSGRVDGFVLVTMSHRAQWYYRLMHKSGVNLDGTDLLKTEPPPIASEEAEAKRYLRRKLVAAVKSLPPELQIPLRLRLRGRDTSEIVESTNLSAAQVRHRIKQAIGILRQRLGNRTDLRDLLPE